MLPSISPLHVGCEGAARIHYLFTSRFEHLPDSTVYLLLVRRPRPLKIPSDCTVNERLYLPPEQWCSLSPCRPGFSSLQVYVGLGYVCYGYVRLTSLGYATNVDAALLREKCRAKRLLQTIFLELGEKPGE